MRTSVWKAFAVSITPFLLGGALAATPALPAGAHGAGFSGSFRPSGPSSFGSSPSFGGSFSKGNSVPSGSFIPHGTAPPYTGVLPSGGPSRHYPYAGRRYRHAWVGGVTGPLWCDDYYCDNGYYYDESDCWVLRRVYNKHRKLIGWRRVYICQ